MPIQRSTCFKLKSPEDAQNMIDAYQTLEHTQQRRLNILRRMANHISASTKFANMEDVKYYDEQCEAHQKLKSFAKDKVAGPPLVLHIET
ncbi:hypothetical protein D0864_08382 [Hortaea werneckii]|uniref:Stress-response A/B barrel domain-containing protein n=1 Tax=Hortaea werneckii TaxID=91943 RepID=A0A3M7EXH2_HORWE|nr:hypothetical protein D0864_08382 [Hortaea werneckii]